ncbi:transcriptional regulator, LacI family [Gluconacetobacter diazotrophicus PA1 5]|nr:transcriptional regulator, LacI family [Gluconacetobacter diazotrophicus PA1 5]
MDRPDSDPPSIAQVAKATNCSVTTVRLVLNGQAGKYRISAATQKIVRDYVDLHGYCLNHAARSLKLRRTDTIGLVVPEIANPFFAGLMACLERLCAARGLVLLTASSGEMPAQEDRAIRELGTRGIDALIVVPCQAPRYGRLLGGAKDIPVVLLDRAYTGAPYTVIASDNFGECVALTDAILDAGEQPHFICANERLPSIGDRIAGFGAACRKRRIRNWRARVHCADQDSIHSAGTIVDALLAQGGPPRALICSSLLMLQGTMERLKLRLGQLPPDITFGTFDDHFMLDFLPNHTFAIRQDADMLAALALDYLDQHPTGPDGPGRVLAPCTFVQRPARR